jgi:hypothetical protein
MVTLAGLRNVPDTIVHSTLNPPLAFKTATLVASFCSRGDANAHKPLIALSKQNVLEAPMGVVDTNLTRCMWFGVQLTIARIAKRPRYRHSGHKGNGIVDPG